MAWFKTLYVTETDLSKVTRFLGPKLPFSFLVKTGISPQRRTLRCQNLFSVSARSCRVWWWVPHRSLQGKTPAVSSAEVWSAPTWIHACRWWQWTHAYRHPHWRETEEMKTDKRQREDKGSGGMMSSFKNSGWRLINPASRCQTVTSDSLLETCSKPI